MGLRRAAGPGWTRISSDMNLLLKGKGSLFHFEFTTGKFWATLWQPKKKLTCEAMEQLCARGCVGHGHGKQKGLLVKGFAER